MSLHDYEMSRDIDTSEIPFYGLIMAAMRRADDNNIALLKQVFPDVFDELQARYNAPGGRLEGENYDTNRP